MKFFFTEKLKDKETTYGLSNGYPNLTLKRCEQKNQDVSVFNFRIEKYSDFQPIYKEVSNTKRRIMQGTYFRIETNYKNQKYFKYIKIFLIVI